MIGLALTLSANQGSSFASIDLIHHTSYIIHVARLGFHRSPFQSAATVEYMRVDATSSERAVPLYVPCIIDPEQRCCMHERHLRQCACAVGWNFLKRAAPEAIPTI